MRPLEDQYFGYEHRWIKLWIFQWVSRIKNFWESLQDLEREWNVIISRSQQPKEG